MNRRGQLVTVLLCGLALSCAHRQLAGQVASPPRFTLATDARAGDPEGVVFTDVVDLVLGPDRRVYLGSGMDRTIQVFDESGHPAGTIGQHGDGPGEFQAVSALGFLSDTLWVSDHVAGRVTFFLTDGTTVRTLRLTSPAPLGHLFHPTTPQAFMADGSAIVRPYVNTLAMDQGGLEPVVPVLRLGQDNSIRDTLAWHHVKHRQLTMTGDDFHLSSSFQPFDDTELMCIAPDGQRLLFVERYAAARGREATFTVTAVNVAGDTVLRITRAYAPKAVSREVRDSLIMFLVGQFTGRPQWAARPEIIERGIRAGLYVPRYYPPVSGAFCDTLGNVWIRREGLPGSAATWEVIDEAGTTIRLIHAPAGAYLYAAGRRFVWGVEYGEYGAPSLFRYRLVGPEEAG